jgi:serine/threonine protein kinase
MELANGKILNNKYKVLKVLKSSGFEITYEAMDISFDRKVVIKEFFPSTIVNRDEMDTVVPFHIHVQIYEKGLEDFLNEVKTLARFDTNPNIINIREYFITNGTAYFVMPFEDGEDLAQYLSKHKNMREKEILDIIFPILNALEEIHKIGMIHRDIKPANIFMRTNKTPLLINFATARYAFEQNSKSLTSILTAGYAPIEQYDSSSVQGAFTDIYALGATIYTMVTNSVLPESVTRMKAILKKQLDPLKPISSSDFSLEFKNTVYKALNVMEEDRYQSIKEFRDELFNEKIKEIDNKNYSNNDISTSIINKENNIQSSEIHLKRIERNGKLGLIDKNANEVTPIKYYEIHSFNEGLAKVALNQLLSKDIKYGFIDKSGTVVIPIKYDYAEGFREGLAKVGLNQLLSKDIKYGFINKNGIEVIPIKYDDVKDLNEGLIKVWLNGKRGFINKNGTVVTPWYYRAWDFTEGLAMVQLNDRYGFIDKNGIEVIPCKYDYANCFSEGLAMVMVNGKSGYIDKNGTVVTPCKYHDAYDFREGLAQVKLNGKWGFVDKNGNEVTPIKYHDTYDFREGLAQVKLNGKWGFVDKNGNEVTPIKYDYIAKHFSEGLVVVELNHRYGFIDKNGTVVIPFLYNGANNFSESLAKVELDGELGYIDKNNTFKKYDTSNDNFIEGLAIVELNNRYGFIDKNGTVVIPIKYDYIAKHFSGGLAKVRINGKLEYIDKNGNPVNLIQRILLKLQ